MLGGMDSNHRHELRMLRVCLQKSSLTRLIFLRVIPLNYLPIFVDSVDSVDIDPTVH